MDQCIKNPNLRHEHLVSDQRHWKTCAQTTDHQHVPVRETSFISDLTGYFTHGAAVGIDIRPRIDLIQQHSTRLSTSYNLNVE